jgi:hypothetical protein
MEEEEYEKLYEEIMEKGKKDYKNMRERIMYNKEGKWLNVITKEESIEVLRKLHDHELSGHFGRDTTYNRIREKYYWKNMKKDIEEYIRKCEKCQKRSKAVGKGPIHPIEVTGIWDTIGIDFVGPLKETENGNKYILVIMDYFSKWPEAIAMKEATAENVYKYLYKEIICRYGIPKKIISDRGSHFNNKKIEELCLKYGIEHGKTSSYHPQANGLVERFNRTLIETLAKISEEQEEWDKHLSEALFTYRTRKHNTTEKTPYYLMFGKEAEGLIRNENREDEIGREEQIQQLNEKRNEILEKIEEKQKKMKDDTNNKRKNVVQFNIGDKVLLKDAALEKQWSKKLQDKWKGPYRIYKVLGKGSYRLRNIENNKVLKNSYNIEHLKRYYE